MFRGILDSIVGKISNLNPIKHFIKYALDRTLNKFLQKQLTLEDFKNGPLNLQDIQINSTLINKSYLVSSPYIVHEGMISKLKISLPPLSDIATQSIEISILGIQITLKPNKKFAQSFKQKMIQLHEMKKFDGEEKQIEGEISQSGPVDFFTELLKKIIMNIKINVSNVAIKLYMNTPSKQSPQFYVMLRIPLIYVDKKQDKQIRKKQIQQIKFNILLPQASLHLLRQDIKFPDYHNLTYKADDFPFKYPSIKHPSTIVILGCQNIPENFLSKIGEWKKDGSINNMNFTQIGFKLSTDYNSKKQVRQKAVNLNIPHFEMMFNPIQIKILSRFVVQIMDFKKILDIVMTELQEIIKQINNQSLSTTKRVMNDSIRKNQSVDFFSSIMMSFTNDMSNQLYNRESKDARKSMFNDDEQMKQSVRIFNLQCEQKMKVLTENKPVNSAMPVQFKAIEFKQVTKIDVNLITLNIYILKYSTAQQYYRIWLNDSSQKKNKINKKIGCDYFMLSIKGVDVKIKVNEKISDVNVNTLKLYNVKLHSTQEEEQAGDEFYDVNSAFHCSHTCINSQLGRHLSEIKQYQLKGESHYCVEQILAITESESEKKIQQNNVKTYSLIPKFMKSNKDSCILYKPAVSIHLDTKKKYSKIHLQVVTTCINLQLLLDFLLITSPLLAYKRLTEIISFKRQQISNKSSSITVPESKTKQYIFQSMYEYREDLQSVEELKSENKNILIIEISQIRIGFRNGQQSKQISQKNSHFYDLIEKQKQKIFEDQSFNKVCFCNVNEVGIYLEITNFFMQKKLSSIKIELQVIDIGIMSIKQSQITNLSSIISIKANNQEQRIRIFRQNTHCQVLLIFIPELHGHFSQDDIMNLVSLIANSIKIIGNILSFRSYLQNEMMVLENKTSQLPKKLKKNESDTQKQIKIMINKIYISLDYFSIFMEQIYLKVNDQLQQNIICKISKIIGGLKRENCVEVMVCKFSQNKMITNAYEHLSDSEIPIADEDIFFSLKSQDKLKIQINFDQRHTYFDKLDKINLSMTIKIKKQTEEVALNKYNQNQFNNNNIQTNKKFKWNYDKNNKGKNKLKKINSAILEQNQRKIINLEIYHLLTIYLCNLIQFNKNLPKIQCFISKIKQQIKQVQQQIKFHKGLALNERKHGQAQNQNSTIQFIIRLHSSLLIDVSPDFIRNDKHRIFSNTRSIIKIALDNQLEQLRVIINNDKNQQLIQGQFSIEYYFLIHEDTSLTLNPILIADDNKLSQLGFKNILQINKLFVKANVNEKNKNVEVKIKSIFGQASIQTLCYINLHFQHFINHHINNNMGVDRLSMYDGDDYIVLQYDASTDPDLDQVVIIEGSSSIDDDFEIEDLTGAFQIYQKKMERKQKYFNILKQRKYNFHSFKNPQISINNFLIQQMCVRISLQKDFHFIKQNELENDQRRFRQKQDDQLHYYVMNLANLKMVTDISISDQNQVIEQKSQKQKMMAISSFIKVEKLRVSLSKQRNYGHNNLRMLEQIKPAQNFIIFNNQNELLIIIQKQPTKMLIKSYNLKLNIGGTTQIFNTLKKIKKINGQIEQNKWKKIYNVNNEKEKKQNNNKNDDTCNQRLLIMVPESFIKITFQYRNLLKIIDQQQVQLKQFILNEQVNDMFYIKQNIKKWTKQQIKNNLGGLVSGTALNLLVKLISQIIALNIKIIGKVAGLFSSSDS